MKEFLNDNIIGYCPQFDAVDEYLTGREALTIYSKLIGLNDVARAIEKAVTRFKLQTFLDTPIINYSGGMKRTLSVAVAMLGDPQIVLLDEPTNGMDPEMRRRVWDNILKLIKDEDRSVLLTSHSMAECDALCSRLAIMVNGEFTCIGTTQHLKNRFGGGYTLQIKVNNEAALNSVKEFIEARFLNSILKDQHGNKIEYIIPHKGNSLGKIFGIMEMNKDNFLIGDYSVSQTTLDQVFINFAKSNNDGDDDENSDEEDDDFDDDDDEENSEDEGENGDLTDVTEVVNNNNTINNDNSNEIHVQVNMEKIAIETHLNTIPPTDDTSIKNNFNSLKKSKHKRKTSSAKSQSRPAIPSFPGRGHNRKASESSRKSIKSNHQQRSRSSSKSKCKKRAVTVINGESCFSNLAYEIEFKNSDACNLSETDTKMNNIMHQTEPPELFNDTITTYTGEDGEYFSRC
jgi:ABC-type multidrug transport system ATPase subunit